MTLPAYVDDSRTVAVLTGFVQVMLEASDIVHDVLGKPLVFKDNGLYTKDELGVTVMVMPREPALAVGVFIYIADPNVATGLSQYAVQIRARSNGVDYRPAAFLLDAFREHPGGPRLNGRTNTDLGGYNATIIYQHSLADLGLDRNDNYEATENYYLLVNDEPGVLDPRPPRFPQP